MNSWKGSQMELTLNFAASKLQQRLKQIKDHKMKALMKLYNKLQNQKDKRLV